MKNCALVLIILSYSMAALSCHKKVDPNKVVLFIDTNGSYQEVIAAKEAACERGETLKVLPAGYKAALAMGKIYEGFTYYVKLKNKYCETKDENKKKCLKYKAQFKNYEARLNKKVKSYKAFLNKKTVQESIQSLADGNKAITSIIGSGHNGGGVIGGDLKGPFKSWKVEKSQIIEAFNESYKGKDGLKNQLHSVYLWGCYTTTAGEVSEWKEGIDSVRIVGGFHGQGPSSSLKESGNLLKDILIKETNIKSKADAKSIQRTLNQLNGASDLFSGFYYKTCNGGEYYQKRAFEKIKGRKVLKERFSTLEEALDCTSQKTKDTISTLELVIPKFIKGEYLIDTPEIINMVRGYYSYAREYSPCIKKDSFANPDRVGLLLFHQGVHSNFDKVFGKKLNKNLEKIIKYGDKIPEETREMLLFVKNHGFKSVSRDYISTALHHLEWTYTSELSPLSLKEKEAAAKDYTNIFNYVYALHPDCMDFLDWHESVDGHIPEAKC